MYRMVSPRLSGPSSKHRNPDSNLRRQLSRSKYPRFIHCIFFIPLLTSFFFLTIPQLRAQTSGGSQDSSLYGDPLAWKNWGGNPYNTHSSFTEHTITPQNVSQLKPKWIYTATGDISATPTVEGDSVYFPDWGGRIYRIHKDTGVTVWNHQISEYTGLSTSVSRSAPAIGTHSVIFGDQFSSAIIAADKTTGKLLWKTEVDDAQGAVISGSPILYGDKVYVGVASRQEELALQAGFVLTFRASIVCLDVETGKIIWKSYLVPQGYTGGAVWESGFAIDPWKGSIFVATGNNYSVPDDVEACIKSSDDPSTQLACLDPQDYVDSIVALDLHDGHIKWGKRLEGPDTWTLSCRNPSNGVPCPDPAGPDFDFGSGPNIFSIWQNGKGIREVVGAGQKSGIYWTLDADTGDVVWATQVGPSGSAGGVMFGSAVDTKRVYVAINNSTHTTYRLQPGNTTTWNAGSWAALDAMTGSFLWQIPATGQNATNPKYPAGAEGQMSAANGVVFAGSMSGDMVAIDASTGSILWKYASGGSVVSGPSIVDGVVYWGSGYTHFKSGSGNNKLYAFSLPN